MQLGEQVAFFACALCTRPQLWILLMFITLLFSKASKVRLLYKTPVKEIENKFQKFWHRQVEPARRFTRSRKKVQDLHKRVFKSFKSRFSLSLLSKYPSLRAQRAHPFLRTRHSDDSARIKFKHGQNFYCIWILYLMWPFPGRETLGWRCL